MTDLAALEKSLEDLRDLRRFKRIDFWRPYDKQQTFFELGATTRERLLMAGNQNGKTEAGSVETSVHMTGLYPEWWKGRRWTRPVRGWIDGETGLLVRDVQQKKLMGPPGVDVDFGTGMIPREAIVDKSLARGVTDAYDTIQIKHYRSDGTPDGVSTATFKSYEQGRQKHQGEPVDFIWCDEEPPADVYSEIVTRTTATGGMVYTTFTPLKGMSEVVRMFLQEKPDSVVTMTIHDALHIPASERAAIIAAWPAHEREARSMGVPMLGSGKVFPYSEELLREPAIVRIPPHWCKLWSVDFGIDHPFAATLLLWDKDNDVIHIHHCYRVSGLLPLQHAQALKKIGAGVPVAWPHDGNQRREAGETGQTTTLAKQYRGHGLRMLPTHATFTDGGYSTEAGILEMQQYMSEGRFKVADHLDPWFEEFRLYHRKDGLLVKSHDDLMSASRIGVMARRFARPVALGSSEFKRRTSNMASDVDFDVFA
jgi:phage terminase large subunit-like protein